MSLGSLPSEVVAQLLEHFTKPVPRPHADEFPSPPALQVDSASLAALARTSTRFHRESLGSLYRHVHISPIVHLATGGTHASVKSLAYAVLQSPRRQEIAPLVQVLHICWSANISTGQIVLDILRACRNVSYLSVDFEHRGDGYEPLPLEALLQVLESMPHLRTLNMRFTQVDVKHDSLYTPACLRLRLPHLLSLRIKGVHSAILDQSIVHPLPSLRHLHIDHFELASSQLVKYIELVTAETELRQLELVDLEESSDILSLLPSRMHTSLEKLTIALDDSIMNLKALSKFKVLQVLDLGYSGFVEQDLSCLPTPLVHLSFFPSTLELLAALAEALRASGYLPRLKRVHLTGADDAFWDDGDASQEQWESALRTLATFESVLRSRGITLSPRLWRNQLEERTLP